MQWNNVMWLFNECTCKILVQESLNLSYIMNILPDRALQAAWSNLQFLSMVINTFKKWIARQNFNDKYGYKIVLGFVRYDNYSTLKSVLWSRFLLPNLASCVDWYRYGATTPSHLGRKLAGPLCTAFSSACQPQRLSTSSDM